MQFELHCVYKAVTDAQTRLSCAAHGARYAACAFTYVTSLDYTRYFAPLIIAAILATAAAQSGRKNNNPPPPPPPPAPPSESLTSKPAYVPTGPPVMSCSAGKPAQPRTEGHRQQQFSAGDFDGK